MRHGLGRHSGQSLVEFALVALVLYLLLAATIELGRATFGAQALQDVARVAARELALEPLPAESLISDLFDPANYDPGDPNKPASRVQDRVYSRVHLVVDLAPGGSRLSAAEVDARFAEMPPVNRMLRPLMIYERTENGRELLHFPGALLVDPYSPSGLSVQVPQVVVRDEDGIETIGWRDVLEVRQSEFLLSGGGMVFLTMNYPFQAAAMVGYTEGPGGPFEPNAGSPITADDDAVLDPDGPSLPLAGVGPAVGPYAGPYGLGVRLAHGREVRPFRRLISVQAAFRREVFE